MLIIYTPISIASLYVFSRPITNDNDSMFNNNYPTCKISFCQFLKYMFNFPDVWGIIDLPKDESMGIDPMKKVDGDYELLSRQLSTTDYKVLENNIA